MPRRFAIAALLLSTPAWGQTPPWPRSCLDHFGSPACISDLQGQLRASERKLRDLDRRIDLERALDNQRFDIDMDAQIRRDDIEYDAWFYREFIQPPQDHYQQRRSKR